MLLRWRPPAQAVPTSGTEHEQAPLLEVKVSASAFPRGRGASRPWVIQGLVLGPSGEF
jgi:hypothetical protein